MERSLCIHDEILLEATDEVALILQERMDGTGKALLMTVSLEVEVVVVGSWAEK